MTNPSNSDINSQIAFLKDERDRVLRSAKEFKEDSITYQLLMKKVQAYIDIEQNMYALKAIAGKVLKS